MIKSVKVRVDPNNKQRTKLFQYAGCSRFAYNWALSREQEHYRQEKKFLSDGELRKEFTQLKKQPEYDWLNDVSNNVTKQAIKDACKAFVNFFKGQCRYPRFKSKKHSMPSFYQDNIKIRFTGTHVKVEGFSMSKKKNKQKLNWIRLCEKDRIPMDTEYKNPRFTYDGLYWYVSVGTEEAESAEMPTGEGIGIDLGVKDLAVCSDRELYGNINKTQKVRKLEKRKRRLQRSISRGYEKNKKGERYCKTSSLIRKEHELLKVSRRLTNIRQNYTNQITSEITNRKPMFVCIEDLNVSGMMKNRHLSKAVQQQNLREFRRQIEYKSAWKNISVVIADRWFPSSKLCSCCGEVKRDLKLSDRIYKCKCGNIIDRDYQAALNLKSYGENAMKNQSAA